MDAVNLTFSVNFKVRVGRASPSAAPHLMLATFVRTTTSPSAIHRSMVLAVLSLTQQFDGGQLLLLH
jgi:hypothetical protein